MNEEVTHNADKMYEDVIYNTNVNNKKKTAMKKIKRCSKRGSIEQEIYRGARPNMMFSDVAKYMSEN